VSPLPAPTGSPLPRYAFSQHWQACVCDSRILWFTARMNTSALDFDSADQRSMFRVDASLPSTAGAFAQHPGTNGFSGRCRILTPLRTSAHG
jgi:hypothetical protein